MALGATVVDAEFNQYN